MDIPDDAMVPMEAIIHSMTADERSDPKSIDGSRRRRIARGSGTAPEDVSGLVKTFSQMQHMMKQMAGMGMMDRMRFAKQMGQMDLMGGRMPNLKMKQRSKRLTAKERAERKKKRRRR
jgi:signal recognition particle subunit SRP54